MLFLEPTTDSKGNKVSPRKNFQVDAGNGMVSERTRQGRARPAAENLGPRRSRSSSRLSSGEDERSLRPRKRIGPGIETSRGDFPERGEMSGPRKRPTRTSLLINQGDGRGGGGDGRGGGGDGRGGGGSGLGPDMKEQERELMWSERESKSPRMSRMGKGLELDRLMKERERLLETRDFDLYETQLQNVEKKIREVVEI